MNDFTNNFIESCDPDKLCTKPLVSVHMITYNHERFISKSIEGVVSQITDYPFELIIGEDCSTDNTREIALEYQKKYPHIIRVIYSKSNVGTHVNFRRVYKSCRGKYIALCEGDDYWIDKYKLSKQINFLSNNDDYVATYHDFIVSHDGNIDESNSNRSNIYDTEPDELVLGGGGFQHSTLCFKNILGDLPDEFYKVTGGDLFLRSLLGNHGKGKFLDDIKPGIYNIHAGGAWSGLNKTEQLTKHVETCCLIAGYYRRTNNPKFSTYFACNAMSKIAQELVLNRTIFLKWIIKTYFNKLYFYYNKIKYRIRIN